MTPRLTRSLLLAAGIAMLVTAVFYWFMKELKPLREKARHVPELHSYTGEINIRPGAPGDTAASPYNIQKSLEIIKERLAKANVEFGLKEESDQTFTFSFGLLNDTTEVPALMTGNSRMAMYEVYTVGSLSGSLQQADTALARHLQANPEDPLLRLAGDHPIRSHDNPLFSVLQPARPYNDGASYPGYIGMVAEKDTALLRQLLYHPVLLRYWPADSRFLFGDKNSFGSSPGYSLLYVIRNHSPRITNRNIVRASSEFDQVTNALVVAMELDAHGAVEFERLTINNVGKPLAICINDKVIQAPIVNQPIMGGHLQITSGGGTDAIAYARAMSILLTSKELPLAVQVNRAKFDLIGKEKAGAGTGTYALIFVLAFAMAMGGQWLVARFNTP